ncbi:MAG: hypothetical protein R3E31_19285 [Chloroflexota bacterium]
MLSGRRWVPGAVAEEPDACPQTLPLASATATQTDTDRMAVAILVTRCRPISAGQRCHWSLAAKPACLTPTATEETAVSLVIEGANTAPSLHAYMSRCIHAGVGLAAAGAGARRASLAAAALAGRRWPGAGWHVLTSKLLLR